MVNRTSIETQCRNVHYAALDRISLTLRTFILFELSHIHRSHFHNHDIKFVDEMGTTFIKVGLYDVEYSPPVFDSVFSELKSLLAWYIDLSSDLGVYIGTIKIPALAKE